MYESVVCRVVTLVMPLLLPMSYLRAQATPAGAAAAALSGVVRDSLGDPIASVEIVLVGEAKGARTDSTGRFELTGVPAGAQVVRFRRLGFSSVEIDWSAVSDTRVEISVRLDALPRQLNPVMTYAREERDRKSGESIVTGTVVDAAGTPLPDVVVQLVGSGRTTISAGDGQFAFRKLPDGDYVVLVRRLGFAPSSKHLRLEGIESRELSFRLRQLPATLDTVRVVERSGFGAIEQAFRDLETRKRFKSVRAVMVVGEDLRPLRKMPLDMVVQWKGGPDFQGFEKLPIVTRRDLLTGNLPAGESCVLLNGRTPRTMALRVLSADQIERLEIYPPNSEYSGTVRDRMGSVPGCRGFGDEHPTYFVVWLRGEDVVR